MSETSDFRSRKALFEASAGNAADAGATRKGVNPTLPPKEPSAAPNAARKVGPATSTAPANAPVTKTETTGSTGKLSTSQPDLKATATVNQRPVTSNATKTPAPASAATVSAAPTKPIGGVKPSTSMELEESKVSGTSTVTARAAGFSKFGVGAQDPPAPSEPAKASVAPFSVLPKAVAVGKFMAGAGAGATASNSPSELARKPTAAAKPSEPAAKPLPKSTSGQLLSEQESKAPLKGKLEALDQALATSTYSPKVDVVPNTAEKRALFEKARQPDTSAKSTEALSESKPELSSGAAEKRALFEKPRQTETTAKSTEALSESKPELSSSATEKRTLTERTKQPGTAAKSSDALSESKSEFPSSAADKRALFERPKASEPPADSKVGVVPSNADKRALFERKAQPEKAPEPEIKTEAAASTADKRSLFEKPKAEATPEKESPFIISKVRQIHERPGLAMEATSPEKPPRSLTTKQDRPAAAATVKEELPRAETVKIPSKSNDSAKKLAKSQEALDMSTKSPVKESDNVRIGEQDASELQKKLLSRKAAPQSEPEESTVKEDPSAYVAAAKVDVRQKANMFTPASSAPAAQTEPPSPGKLKPKKPTGAKTEEIKHSTEELARSADSLSEYPPDNLPQEGGDSETLRLDMKSKMAKVELAMQTKSKARLLKATTVQAEGEDPPSVEASTEDLGGKTIAGGIPVVFQRMVVQPMSNSTESLDSLGGAPVGSEVDLNASFSAMSQADQSELSTSMNVSTPPEPESKAIQAPAEPKKKPVLLRKVETKGKIVPSNSASNLAGKRRVANKIATANTRLEEKKEPEQNPVPEPIDDEAEVVTSGPVDATPQKVDIPAKLYDYNNSPIQEFPDDSTLQTRTLVRPRAVTGSKNPSPLNPAHVGEVHVPEPPKSPRKMTASGPAVPPRPASGSVSSRSSQTTKPSPLKSEEKSQSTQPSMPRKTVDPSNRKSEPPVTHLDELESPTLPPRPQSAVKNWVTITGPPVPPLWKKPARGKVLRWVVGVEYEQRHVH